MSNTGSPRAGLVPVVPQGQLELPSTSGLKGPDQGGLLSYRELLQFYIVQTKWPAQTPPPVLSFNDLQLFYQIHAGRPLTPLPPALPPASIKNVDAFLTEDEVVTKEEAKEAFAFIKESFTSVSEEQTKMKAGLHGLASKIDEVQGKAAEDVTALACVVDDALSHASSVVSDLSARLTDAELQQAAVKAAAERAHAASDAALLESATARRKQQLARAQLKAELQAAALQSQSTMERAALQAAQAMADARSTHVEVPRLDAMVLQLPAELCAMQVASQQAQERALWLESELSAAQDHIGTAEHKAAQAEQRQLSLQKRMDDWDAFDPDLHAAFNALLTPPADEERMQPVGTAHPAGSEATVQSTHQVHNPAQTRAATGVSASRMQFQIALYGESAPQMHVQTPIQTRTSQQSMQQGTFRFADAPMFPHVQQAHASVHQAQTSAQ